MKIRFSFLLLFLITGNLLSQNDYEERIYEYMQKGYDHYYDDNDSLYYYFKKAKKIAKTNNDYDYLIALYNIENFAATQYYDLDVIKNNLDTLKLILKNKKAQIDSLPNKIFLEAEINYTKGVLYFELQNLKQSRFYFKKVINNTERPKDSIYFIEYIRLVNGGNNYLAKMLNNENKSNQAKEIYLESLRSIKNNKYSTSLIEDYNNITILLAEIYQKEGAYNKANDNILKVLDYYINITKNSNRIISSYHNIVDNHINLKQLDSAQFYLNKMKDNLTKNHPFWYRYYIAQSNIFKAKKNYKPATIALEKALQLVKQKWNNQPHNDIAEIYNKIGDLYAETMNPNNAIVNYDLAIKQFENDTLNSAINQTTLFKSLKLKTSALNQIKNYNSTVETSEKALAVLDLLKPTFKNYNDKLFLIDNAFPVFESGLDALFKRYKNTKDKMLIDKAFSYSEKSKSALLLEALLSIKATDYANIPKEIIEKEKLLKSRIIYLEKKLNSKKTDALEDELFETKSQYRTLILDLESNYKNYYDLKYNSDVISTESIQEELNNNDLLISFFYGSSSIYGIAIGKNNKQFIRLSIDSNFENNLISFQKDISNPKSNIDLLVKQSHLIYKQLLQPFLKETTIKNLIIIPDGLLNYIPFSSLNTSENGTKYLVEDYAVSYVNSATLLSQLQEQQENNNEVLAFAPSFINENNQLLPLPNNKKEVEAILTHVKGKSYINNDASLQNFNETSNNYNIIHLATHAIFDDNNPEYSFLAFAPKAETENLLYTKDLYNLKLNANLVTLSACESGIGDLKRGEGLMSLARGFYFSGAKSIASTLWKINDASASKLMDRFYLHLSKNNSKPVALQKAQVNFINANRENGLSHPYYWSGFVISGNTSPLNNPNPNYWLWVIAGFGLITGLAFVYFGTKKVG